MIGRDADRKLQQVGLHILRWWNDEQVGGYGKESYTEFLQLS